MKWGFLHRHIFTYYSSNQAIVICHFFFLVFVQMNEILHNQRRKIMRTKFVQYENISEKYWDFVDFMVTFTKIYFVTSLTVLE